MILTSIKNCKTCSNAKVVGTFDKLNVTCKSNDYVHKNNFKKNGDNCAGRCSGYNDIGKHRDGLIENNKFIDFVNGGKAEFILHSTKTNADFAFLIKKTENSEYNVSVIRAHGYFLVGSIKLNEEDNKYSYKQIDKTYLSDNIDIRSLLYVFNKLSKNEDIQYLEIYTMCKCSVCQKELISEYDMSLGMHEKCVRLINT